MTEFYWEVKLKAPRRVFRLFLLLICSILCECLEIPPCTSVYQRVLSHCHHTLQKLEFRSWTLRPPALKFPFRTPAFYVILCFSKSGPLLTHYQNMLLWTMCLNILLWTLASDVPGVWPVHRPLPCCPALLTTDPAGGSLLESFSVWSYFRSRVKFH